MSVVCACHIRRERWSINFFDHEEIERHLLATPKERELIKRYFPISVKKLDRTPAKLFSDVLPIKCENCDKNLLEPPSGIWALWHADTRKNAEYSAKRFVDMHFA